MVKILYLVIILINPFLIESLIASGNKESALQKFSRSRVVWETNFHLIDVKEKHACAKEGNPNICRSIPALKALPSELLPQNTGQGHFCSLFWGDQYQYSSFDNCNVNYGSESHSGTSSHFAEPEELEARKMERTKQIQRNAIKISSECCNGWSAGINLEPNKLSI